MQSFMWICEFMQQAILWETILAKKCFTVIIPDARSIDLFWVMCRLPYYFSNFLVILYIFSQAVVNSTHIVLQSIWFWSLQFIHKFQQIYTICSEFNLLMTLQFVWLWIVFEFKGIVFQRTDNSINNCN